MEISAEELGALVAERDRFKSEASDHYQTAYSLRMELNGTNTNLRAARAEADQLRTRLAEVEGERDRLLGWKEEALVVLCEHFEAFHSILAGEGVLGATIGSEAARVDAARRAELSKLRPVVEAARGLTRLSEWWVTSDHDGGMFCITCNFSLSHGEHDPDCPAIALEQALAALDAGEDES